MRGALLVGTALVIASAPAAAQLPSTPNPLDRLMSEPPLVVTVPGMTVLDGGRAEALLDSRLTWPAKADAPFALSLRGGMVARADALYSRSGIETGIRSVAGPVHWHANAAVDIGSGNGARQVFTMALGGGWDALTLDVRTTWFNDAPPDSGNAFFDRADPLAANAPIDGRYTDAELQGQHSLGRLQAQVVGGTRLGGNGNGPQQWAWAELQHPVWQRLSLIAAAGVRPYRADYGRIGGRFAELRMQWRTSRRPDGVPRAIQHASQPMLIVLPLAADSFRLQLHAPGATAVAVKGDFTAWRTVPMQRSGTPGAWSLDVRAPAGIYHINMRTQDGVWIVPPGLVAVPDGFGGSTGLIKFTTGGEGGEQ